MSRLILAATLSILSFGSLRAATQPWEGAPFTADPKALLAAAEAVKPAKPEDGVVVLLDETHVVLDANGLATRTERLVYLVTDEGAVEGWSSIDSDWSPWYEEQPKVAARVIAKDGSIHMLDPKSFGKSDAEDEPDMFTDTRVLSGPLPAVAPGSVVEQVVTHHDKTAVHDVGTAYRHQFGRWVESQQSRLIVEYPVALTFHLVNRTAPAIKPVESNANGIKRLVFESGVIPGYEASETNLPPDVERHSYVAFSTGKSWQDVATKYRAIVDQQIAAGPLPAANASAAKDAREVAATVLARLQKDIRYAGVEFGEGSIIPRSPKETLAHKYGDCKDKATLLVALLRQEGLAAHVALLNSGYGYDVDAELPGLSHFNHVIVYVAGAQPFWIDPTDEFARAGELPEQDQGRRALIASVDTNSLVETPIADGSANHTVENRSFTLAEDGKSTVVETTEYSGSEERSFRRYYATTDAKHVREQLEKFVKDNYFAEALGKYETTDPHDLSKPFRLTVEGLRAARGATEKGEAVVGFFEADLASDMPPSLKRADDESAEDEEPANAKKPKKRVHDFFFYEPYTKDIHVLVQAPSGYVLHALPEPATTPLGTAKLTSAFSEPEPGKLMADYHFESGPRRITAAKFEETRKALAELVSRKAVLFTWDQLGRKYADAGEVGKAIAEFRRLAALHPNEALHHIDIANALLAAGFGTAAREEAKRAIAIEPKSAKAHQALALILVHDEIGREFGKGFDLEGSIKEYRKAKELDPRNVALIGELSIVLQRNADGDEFGEGAHLDEAIAEYTGLKGLKEKVNQPYADRQLMALYVHTGRFKELKELTAQTKDTEKKDAMSLVAIAALDGGAAAVKAADAIELSKRRTTMTLAGSVLATVRRYPEAVELLTAAIQGAPNAAELRTQLDIVKKMKKVEEYPVKDDDPASVIRQFVITSILDEEAAERFMTAESKTVFGEKELNEPKRAEQAKKTAAARKAMRKFGNRAVIADAALAAFQLQQEGDDKTGFRMLGRATVKGVPEIATFLVKEGTTYRIAATSEAPEMLALHALHLADGGNTEAARQWLNWARDYVHGGEDEDPVASNPFAALWSRDQQASTVSEIRAASAALLPVSKKAAEVALPVLVSERAKAAEEKQWRIDQALATAYAETEKWNDLLATADRLLARHERSDSAFGSSIKALLNLNREDEAKERAKARLAKRANDRMALRTLGEIAETRGEYADAMASFAKVIDTPDANASDYNSLAWAAVFAGADLDKAIDDARRADGLQPGSYAILNTLATAYADHGNSAEARQTLLESLDAAPGEELRGADWYIVGRIAENYGINDVARDAYQRIKKPAKEHGSPYELAQKRLQAMKK